MDAKTTTLTPASVLAERGPVRIMGESLAYREARTRLLAEEIELRRHIERVAQMRRELPPGAEVTGDYQFMGEDGQLTDLAGLFGDKQTLFTYSYMFGPERELPCPMCTAFLGPLDANAEDLAQKLSVVVIARSPIEKLVKWKQDRGWRHLRLYTDVDGHFSRDWFALSPDGHDIPAMNVFTRRDGTLRHFWSGEMTNDAADPGQDPRGAPEMEPLWNVLDVTPEGRDASWYPSLRY